MATGSLTLTALTGPFCPAPNKCVFFAECILPPAAALKRPFASVDSEGGLSALRPPPRLGLPGLPHTGCTAQGLRAPRPRAPTWPPPPVVGLALSPPHTRAFSDTWLHSASRGPTLPAFAGFLRGAALAPGKRKLPPDGSFCRLRRPGPQPGPHAARYGSEWTDVRGEPRPDTLLQKHSAQKVPPLLHTNHPGPQVKRSPRRIATSRPRTQSRRRSASRATS